MIRLIVIDVDGVLSPGEAAPLDFAVLQRLAEVNDRARHDPHHPAVTLCTGRPAPYVEVLMQAIYVAIRGWTGINGYPDQDAGVRASGGTWQHEESP